MNLTIQYCALPGCGKPLSNWRRKCCCKSHQGIYSAKSRHGTLGQPNRMTPSGEKKPRKTAEQKKSEWVAYTVARRKKRDKSMPEWANKELILEFYTEARRLSEETGIQHHVDHIIPSNHKLVCGLHNEFNLQVMSRSDNQSKSNKFEII